MGTYDSDEREYWESLTDAFPCLVHHLKTIEINGFMRGGGLDYSIHGFMGGSLVWYITSRLSRLMALWVELV